MCKQNILVSSPSTSYHHLGIIIIIIADSDVDISPHKLNSFACYLFCRCPAAGALVVQAARTLREMCPFASVLAADLATKTRSQRETANELVYEAAQHQEEQQQEQQQQQQKSTGTVSGSVGFKRPRAGSPVVADDFGVREKKLFHNANERRRRRHMNALYWKLFSLLPQSINILMARINNPEIVDMALDYIPRLEKKLTVLKQRRDKLLAIQSTCDDEKTEWELWMKTKAAEDETDEKEMKVSVLVTSGEGGNNAAAAVITVEEEAAASSSSCSCTSTWWVLVLLQTHRQSFRFEVTTASMVVSDHKAWHCLHLHAVAVAGNGTASLNAASLRLKLLESLLLSYTAHHQYHHHHHQTEANAVMAGTSIMKTTMTISTQPRHEYEHEQEQEHESLIPNLFVPLTLPDIAMDPRPGMPWMATYSQ